MPKLFDLNVVGVIVASIAFFFVGYLWYGVIFTDLWMSEMGITAQDGVDESPIWMAGGFLITILQVIGVGLVLKWKGAGTIGEAVKTALIIWVLFALPFAHYQYLYSAMHSSTILMIDASHLLVGWVVSAVILSVIK